MSAGFCYVAQECSGFPGPDFLDYAATCGASVISPMSGLVSTWTDEGDRSEVSREDFLKLLGSTARLTFQFWLSDEVDVGCSFRRVAGRCVAVCSMDGLDVGEKQRVIAWQINYFRRLALADTAVLLVVDGNGKTSDYDWDGLVLGTGRPPEDVPDVVGFKRGVIDLGSHFTNFTGEEIAGCSLMSPRF